MVLPIQSLSLQLHIDFLFSGREAALESFLRLPYEKRREMGLCGRRFVEERFDRNFVVAAYLEELAVAINFIHKTDRYE